ncbi:hypothetical protein RS75_24510 [Rhizobium nepotum 39/7]|uniref:Uncharacterized protein n=1 Tax=Rhizobium nepotum 39/7 TaxID=1368418 RepID=A0ABR5CKD4_9HYPH|nr:hypothetical protein RS75_24510 [Rhizobium nepotum 39/7]
MGMDFVVQQGDGTPTGPRFGSFYIRGTPGLGGLSMSMDWWTRVCRVPLQPFGFDVMPVARSSGVDV